MQSKNRQNVSTNEIYAHIGSKRDLLYVLFRRKGAFCAMFLGIVFAVTLYTTMSPEIYQSEAKILIRVGRESLAVDPTIAGPTVSLSQSRENEVNSELAILKSRVLAERVVDKIGPETFLAGGKTNNVDVESGSAVNLLAGVWQNLRDVIRLVLGKSLEESLPVREKAITAMMRSLEVAAEPKTHVINITFESQNPLFGRSVLTSFIGMYQEHHIVVHSMQASPQFFHDQADKLLKKLKEKEELLEQFRVENKISAVIIQKEKLFDQISQLQSEISEIESQISASKAHIASLEGNLQGRSSKVEVGRVSGRKNMAFDGIKARLFDFQIKEADLAARYPDNHRELIEVREQVRLAEEALGNERLTDEVTTGIDPTYQALQLALETERARLQAMIARQKTLKEGSAVPRLELSTLVKNEMTEARLKRDVTLLENEYLQYRQDMQRMNASRALDLDKVSNVSIIQPATMPLDPIKPKKALQLGLGMVFGFFGAVCLAFALEYFDDSLKTKEDVEKRLGLDVIASVPCEESRLCI